MNALFVLIFTCGGALAIGRGLDLALWTDWSTGLCTAGSVWLRYGGLWAALVVGIIAARKLARQPLVLRSACRPVGVTSVLGGVCVGLAGAVREVNGGEDVVLYGSGEVIVSPDRQETERFEQALKKQQSMSDAYNAVLGKSARTLDGRDVRVCTNIGNWKDSSELDVLDTCDGVGLYRTEFIYMESDGYPTEEQQFEYYRTVVQRAHGNEVIIRTLDIGGDKKASYMDLPQESNPFLGYRAIRLCLGHPDIFLVQLRAILRASAYGKAAIMFPMIASVWEVKECRRACQRVMDELTAEGIPFNPDTEIGIMIETPAAVFMAPELARLVDFFSVGTNDLTQYTLACDRQRSDLGKFFDPHHPAVLRALKMAADAAHEAGIWIGICGELGADPDLLPTFLAIGIDELSVAPSAVLPLRAALRKSIANRCTLDLLMS